MKTDLTKIREMLPAPMTGEVNKRDRERVLHAFPFLSSCGHDGYLALAKYLDGTPERFYSLEALRAYTEVLKKEFSRNPTRLIKILNESSDDIDRALLTLNEIGREDWHDTTIESDEYAFMRLCDRSLQPAYLKLSEGVLHRFISPIAMCSRLERKKSISDLWKLSKCIEEIIIRADCSSLVAHCDSTLRNSIAHGRITYKQYEVVYFDKNGKSQTFSDTAVVEMVDGLVDTCNGCALALKLFYRQHLGEKLKVPRQVMLEELQADTKTPWWHIEVCLESELSGKPQLVVYARPMSRDYHKIQYMCLYSGILAEHFAPGFDRYMVSLRSPIALPGWAIFDGKKLRDIRKRGGPRSMEEYKGVIENDLVFYKPKVALPRFLCILETLLMSFRLNIHPFFDEIRKIFDQIPITARQAEIHRNGWRSVINGSVVVRIADKDDPQQAVKKARKRIIKVARRLARKNAQWSNIAKYLPTGYARIGVFQTDRRHRQLRGLSPNLICTVQIQSISRITAPDIAAAKIETVGSHRIAWNKAWLDSLPTTSS
jgi:hypothetical protein